MSILRDIDNSSGEYYSVGKMYANRNDTSTHTHMYTCIILHSLALYIFFVLTACPNINKIWFIRIKNGTHKEYNFVCISIARRSRHANKWKANQMVKKVRTNEQNTK